MIPRRVRSFFGRIWALQLIQVAGTALRDAGRRSRAGFLADHFFSSAFFPKDIKKCWLRMKSDPFEIAGVAMT
jgi:hypothetical protein